MRKTAIACHIKDNITTSSVGAHQPSSALFPRHAIGSFLMRRPFFRIQDRFEVRFGILQLMYLVPVVYTVSRMTRSSSFPAHNSFSESQAFLGSHKVVCLACLIISCSYNKNINHLIDHQAQFENGP
jgi:hypothetical protein